MKIEELMIDDWVMTPEGPMMVEAIDATLNACICRKRNGDRFSCKDFKKEIQPIELSNKTPMSGAHCSSKHLHSAYNPIDYIITENVDIKIKAKYVHEIQHALRLAGLYEQANDFLL